MVYTYSTLVADRDTAGSIKEWVNATDIPSTTILAEAEASIYRDLRVREMLTKSTGTLAAGASAIALSTFPRYRQTYLLKFTGEGGTREILAEPLTLPDVVEKIHWDANGDRVTGPPQFWATDADNIVFDLEADQSYSYWFWYYQALESLSVSNETNFLTDKYPSMLRSACLMFAAEWRKDSQERAYYERMLGGLILAASVDSDREMAGTQITIVPE